MTKCYGLNENLTLTLAELSDYRNQGQGKRAGRYLRFFCPIHGSDNQRSLSLNPDSGRFECYACGAWGYLAEKRPDRSHDYKHGRNASQRKGREESIYSRAQPTQTPSLQSEPKGEKDLIDKLMEFQKCLPGSWGEKYLYWRRIPLEVAKLFGVGYAAPGKWPSKKRDWKWGRLVFPHTNSAGEVVNLYGRAIGSNAKVPKCLRHDHLPGPKGIFNAPALACENVFICEGVFDVLSLGAAGHLIPGRLEACALFGLDGLRWNRVKAKQLVFAFDRDTAGNKWRELAWQGRLLGLHVYYLPAATYAGHKDLNEVWVATGNLDIGAWDNPADQILQEPRSMDVGETLEIALSGDLKYPVRLPVVPAHRNVLGENVWLCPDRKSAETLARASGGDSLICEPQELVCIMKLLQDNCQHLEMLLMAKKMFGGTFIAGTNSIGGDGFSRIGG